MKYLHFEEKKSHWKNNAPNWRNNPCRCIKLLSIIGFSLIYTYLTGWCSRHHTRAMIWQMDEKTKNEHKEWREKNMMKQVCLRLYCSYHRLIASLYFIFIINNCYCHWHSCHVECFFTLAHTIRQQYLFAPFFFHSVRRCWLDFCLFQFLNWP